MELSFFYLLFIDNYYPSVCKVVIFKNFSIGCKNFEMWFSVLMCCEITLCFSFMYDCNEYLEQFVNKVLNLLKWEL